MSRGLAERPPTFVLVHGAWHGGWCYERVAAALSQEGFRVLSPTLAGLAERADLLSPTIGLAEHVAEIVELLDDEQLDDVVLCGHSYGGMVVTGVAQERAERIRALVYLDAFVPRAGASILDMGDEASRGLLETLLMPPDLHYLRPVPAELLHVNPADREWVDGRCTPQPYKTFQDHLDSVDALDRVPRKVYVRSAGYNAPSFLETADACTAQGWTVTVLPHGHDLMVDAPAEVAHILKAAAAPGDEMGALAL